jgi:hypothetical protein
MKRRAGMFLDSPSIKSLNMLMMGYNIARRDQDLPLTKQELKFQEFQQWSQNKYNVLSCELIQTPNQRLLLASLTSRSGFPGYFLFPSFAPTI